MKIEQSYILSGFLMLALFASFDVAANARGSGHGGSGGHASGGAHAGGGVTLAKAAAVSSGGGSASHTTSAFHGRRGLGRVRSPRGGGGGDERDTTDNFQQLPPEAYNHGHSGNDPAGPIVQNFNWDKGERSQYPLNPTVNTLNAAMSSTASHAKPAEHSRNHAARQR
jgi:hypothetical protein